MKQQNSDYNLDNIKDSKITIIEKDKGNDKSIKTMTTTKKITIGLTASLGTLAIGGASAGFGVLGQKVNAFEMRLDLSELEMLVSRKELLQRNINDLDRCANKTIDIKGRIKEMEQDLENINARIKQLRDRGVR